jgi:hypothetical protein
MEGREWRLSLSVEAVLILVYLFLFRDKGLLGALAAGKATQS